MQKNVIAEAEDESKDFFVEYFAHYFWTFSFLPFIKN